MTPFTSYQRRLFVFLSVANFFEGYDFLALAQVLPNVRRDLGLSPDQGGALIGVINIGTMLAYLLVRKADVWGRRRVLGITIAGYTVASFFTGLMPNAVGFMLCQLLARVFLIGEWAVAMVYAAEEFPADRRGLVLGIIQASASLGAILCAGLVPALLKTSVGWRAVYFVGTLPLLLMAFLRRGLRETQRFSALQPNNNPGGGWQELARIWRTPYRGRVVLMALIWGLTYCCSSNAMLFWKEFAVGEAGLTDAQVGKCLTVASLASLPLLFAVGRLLDRMGRRAGAVLIFGTLIVGSVAEYSLRSTWGLAAVLILGIFGVGAVLTVLNAFTTELFPTDLRSNAIAWSNNLLGRFSAVVSPFFIGHAAAQYGFGPTLRVTAVFPLLALILILWRLPETGGKELEDSAAVSSAS